MDIYAILGLIIFIAVFLVVAFLMRLYLRCRSDNGYNMGRNHMHELGFTDDDITQGKDDEDADMYVFRKPNKRQNTDDK